MPPSVSATPPASPGNGQRVGCSDSQRRSSAWRRRGRQFLRRRSQWPRRRCLARRSASVLELIVEAFIALSNCTVPPNSRAHSCAYRSASRRRSRAARRAEPEAVKSVANVPPSASATPLAAEAVSYGFGIRRRRVRRERSGVGSGVVGHRGRDDGAGRQRASACPVDRRSVHRVIELHGHREFTDTFVLPLAGVPATAESSTSW